MENCHFLNNAPCVLYAVEYTIDAVEYDIYDILFKSESYMYIYIYRISLYVLRSI